MARGDPVSWCVILSLNVPVLFLHVVISLLSVSVCHVLSHIIFLLWFDYLSCVSSLFSSLLLTFDFSDLETSVDSRCTTDSADSAFIGRRYWFLASSFLPFLFSNHLLPSSPTQEVRLHIRLQDKNRNFPKCFLVNVLLSIFLCLVIYRNVSTSPHCPPIAWLFVNMCVCIICVYMSLKVCIYVLFIFWLSRHLICDCVFCLHIFKAELHDGTHSQISLIKVMLTSNRQWLWPVWNPHSVA